jgi:hypothetical protein
MRVMEYSDLPEGSKCCKCELTENTMLFIDCEFSKPKCLCFDCTVAVLSSQGKHCDKLEKMAMEQLTEIAGLKYQIRELEKENT